MISFGEIEVEGQHYDYDVIIDGGTVRRRDKSASKAHRERYGHTPLSISEDLPWGKGVLIVGTGVYGRMPIMPEVRAEAERRNMKLIVVPTKEACRMLGELKDREVHAVLHTTC